MRHLLLFLSILFFTPSFAQVNEKNLKKHISYLASDKMKGRQTGSKQVKKAAHYIEKQFRKYGLQPLGTHGFRQPFTAKVKRIVVPDSIRQAENIIGFIDNNAKKTIVIGAHYDHIGHGELGNSKEDIKSGNIHNGADDNASGVAGMLELARIFSNNGIKEDFNLLFIAFGAEELGLLGSKYFVENPTLELEKIHWMLNFDMIGRYNSDNKLAIIGYGTSYKFAEIFANVDTFLELNLSRDGNGGSDQTSFYLKNIPVLFFHTGGHEDYHKPTDDTEKINYDDLKDIINLAEYVILGSMDFEEMDFIWTN